MFFLSVWDSPISHRFTAYKIVGHFLGLSYRKISGSNQFKNIFLRISNMSVPYPHAQLRGRTVIKKVMDIFRTLWSGSLSVAAMLDFSGKANTSIHGLGEDDTAMFGVASPKAGWSGLSIIVSLFVC